VTHTHTHPPPSPRHKIRVTTAALAAVAAPARCRRCCRVPRRDSWAPMTRQPPCSQVRLCECGGEACCSRCMAPTMHRPQCACAPFKHTRARARALTPRRPRRARYVSCGAARHCCRNTRAPGGARLGQRPGQWRGGQRPRRGATRGRWCRAEAGLGGPEARRRQGTTRSVHRGECAWLGGMRLRACLMLPVADRLLQLWPADTTGRDGCGARRDVQRRALQAPERPGAGQDLPG
jgi:hypothetical protein